MSLSASENYKHYKNVIEAVLMASDEPLSLEKLGAVLGAEMEVPLKEIKILVEELQTDYEDHGIELKRLSSGYAFQTKTEYASWVTRLFEEKPPKYSRALLETLVIIAYRQPVTRPEIEAIRGVAVSSNIIKTLLDRDWIRIAGHRDVPGKPTLFSTTTYFLDYFNLSSLSDLPKLESMSSLLSQATEIAASLENNTTENTKREDETLSERTESSQSTEEETENRANGEIIQ